MVGFSGSYHDTLEFRVGDENEEVEERGGLYFLNLKRDVQ